MGKVGFPCWGLVAFTPLGRKDLVGPGKPPNLFSSQLPSVSLETQALRPAESPGLLKVVRPQEASHSARALHLTLGQSQPCSEGAAGMYTFAQSSGGWTWAGARAGGASDEVRSSPRFLGGAGGGTTSLCRVPTHPGCGAVLQHPQETEGIPGQGVPESPLLPALWPDHQLLVQGAISAEAA